MKLSSLKIRCKAQFWWVFRGVDEHSTFLNLINHLLINHMLAAKEFNGYSIVSKLN